MSIYKELFDIQQKLIVAKSQRNAFGNYNYRSCEDILEALKKVTLSAITLTDDLVMVGDRYYIKSTATITNEKGESISSTAFAREDLERKGMSADQLTGSCGSYSRKYALNGLFAIDDTKDADTIDNRHNLGNAEKIAEYKIMLAQSNSMADLKDTFVNVIPKKYHKELSSYKDVIKKQIESAIDSGELGR